MIRVGVAGWDYPDWNGIVYPAGARGSFDKLAYIARYVDVVEINSSFYRPTAPRVADSWVRRTADRPGLRFTAKVHRGCTHETPADPRQAAAPTIEGLLPLREAGKLEALLVQFPQSFHFDSPSIDRLERLVAAFEGWPAVVEVRHRSWEEPQADAWFKRNGIGCCVVDQPAVGGSTTRLRPRVTGAVGYLRLHGRNARDWFRPDAGRDERYDYRYDAGELDELSACARTMAQQAESLVVVQNNHFRGQALVNALQMKSRLQGRAPRAPDSLVACYPELETEVSVERTRLF